MNYVDWVDALAWVMWPNGEAKAFLEELNQTYPTDWAGRATHKEMSLIEAAGEGMYPNDPPHPLSPGPVCSIYRAKRQLIDELLAGDRGAEGRRRIDSLPELVPANAWRGSDVVAGDYGFELQFRGSTLYYDIHLCREASQTYEGCSSSEAGRQTGAGALTVDALPDEYAEALPRYRLQRDHAVWWNWPETIIWVMTRDLNEVAARQAWRDYLISRGEKPDGALLFALLGSGQEQYDAKARLVAALAAEKVKAKGTVASGDEVEIPSNKWTDLQVSYNNTVHLGPKGRPFDIAYRDLWFCRERLLVAFPAIEDISAERPDATGPMVVPFIPTGAPGAPSGMTAINMIFDERIASEAVADGVGAEARELVKAYESDPRFPAEAGWPKMSAGTIQNNIRSRFNNLKAATK